MPHSLHPPHASLVIAHNFGSITEDLRHRTAGRRDAHVHTPDMVRRQVINSVGQRIRRHTQDAAVPELERLVDEHGSNIGRDSVVVHERAKCQVLDVALELFVTCEVEASVDPALVEVLVAKEICKPFVKQADDLVIDAADRKVRYENNIPLPQTESGPRNWNPILPAGRFALDLSGRLTVWGLKKVLYHTFHY